MCKYIYYCDLFFTIPLMAMPQSYVNIKLDLEVVRAELDTQLLDFLTMDYDFSHQKWGTLEGVKNRYSYDDIMEYCGRFNIKKMNRIINKILALGEYYFNKNEKTNFELILYALSDVNVAFRTHGLYVVYNSYLENMKYSHHSMTYEQFHDQIHELAFSYFNKLLNLYTKKKGNSQKLLKELSER